MMELSSAVCTVFCFACSSPSSIASGSFASAYFIGRYPPPSRFALSVSLGSISAASFRLLLFGLDGANIVHCDYGSYLFRIARVWLWFLSLPRVCVSPGSHFFFWSPQQWLDGSPVKQSCFIHLGNFVFFGGKPDFTVLFCDSRM